MDYFFFSLFFFSACIMCVGKVHGSMGQHTPSPLERLHTSSGKMANVCNESIFWPIFGRFQLFHFFPIQGALDQGFYWI
ncbi:hypothetical protein BC939DRAFT_468476 [Gamsiella multidivaricata]|uniref:uncharacterized protein n=1 Tax=Gamsiella multidivaricata TaxID=101098 RepID=UPI002221147C|nr:uncharacterized protein BC939DRAFT_468476 [Gamsiella multidivaricata]KAI7816633.1 hypothetical protein BC939DRAFT_468476 [Gamsiella multidivaricata]